MKHIVRFVVFSLMGLVAAPAFGGMPGFAGLSASADTAETSITNPAGMARLGEEASTLRLVLVQSFGEFEVDETRTSTRGGDPDTDKTPMFVPLGFYVRQLSEQVHGGISFTVPSGFGSDYGSQWAGRYYTDNYSLVYLAITPALSVRVNDAWSFGAAVGINYTATSSEVAINTLGGGNDGKLEADLDGIGTNVSVSTLWQWDTKTRVGVVYTSEATADLEGDLKFKNPGPVLGPLIQQGVIGDELEVENTLPQRINLGFWHELPSGARVTADALWMDFSEFGTSSVSLEGTQLMVDESGAFEDFRAYSVGYAFPPREGKRYSVGAFYMTDPAKGSARGLALPLDNMWGFGAGVQLERQDHALLDLNINVLDYGEGAVDTGAAAVRGRVAGERETPYALVLDVAWHF